MEWINRKAHNCKWIRRGGGIRDQQQQKQHGACITWMADHVSGVVAVPMEDLLAYPARVYFARLNLLVFLFHVISELHGILELLVAFDAHCGRSLGVCNSVGVAKRKNNTKSKVETPTCTSQKPQDKHLEIKRHRRVLPKENLSQQRTSHYWCLRSIQQWLQNNTLYTSKKVRLSMEGYL